MPPADSGPLPTGAPTPEHPGAQQPGARHRPGRHPGDRPTVGPPRPARRPIVLEAHGDRRVDDWFWLRQRDDPEVARPAPGGERLHRAPARRPSPTCADALFDEIKARIVETDLSVPVRKGPWWYYQRTVEGQTTRSTAVFRSTAPVATPAPRRCPRSRPLRARCPAPWPDEQVLLDENDLAGDLAYLDVANLAVSPGHCCLAYATDTTGDERFTLRVRDLELGADLDDAIEAHVVRRGVGRRRRHALLHPARRRQPAPPAVAPPGRHRPRPRRPGRRGARRALPPRRGPHQGRRLRRRRAAVEGHLGGPRHPRRPHPSAAPRVVEPAPSGRGVRRRAPRRARSCSSPTTRRRTSEWWPPPPPTPAATHWQEVVAHRPDVAPRGTRRLRPAPRRSTSGARAPADPGGGAAARTGPMGRRPAPRGIARAVPGDPLGVVGRAQPRVRHHRAALRVLVARDAALGLRPRHGRAAEPCCASANRSSAATTRRDYATERLWATAPDGAARAHVGRGAAATCPRDGSAPCLLYGYGAYEHEHRPRLLLGRA